MNFAIQKQYATVENLIDHFDCDKLWGGLICVAFLSLFFLPARYKIRLTKYFLNSDCGECRTPENDDNRLLELHLAAQYCNRKAKYVEACKRIVSMRPSLVNRSMPPYDYTPFHRVCSNGSVELVRFMLAHGANVRALSVHGDGPFYLASHAFVTGKTRSLALLEALVEAGCDINGRRYNGYTALHMAARYGDRDLVRWLLENGANPIPDNCRRTPFQFALKYGRVETALMFAKSSELPAADTDISDEE